MTRHLRTTASSDPALWRRHVWSISRIRKGSIMALDSRRRFNTAWISLIVLAAVLCLVPVRSVNAEKNAAWKDNTYRVVRVSDGDTFVATDGNIRFKVRIAGIDAPEKRQPYGKNAHYRLTQLLEKQEIRIEPVGKGYDRYSRVLGKVYIANRDIGVILVNDGLATYYRPTCRDFPEARKKYNYDPRPYIAAEIAARKKHRGMWRDRDTELPCEYRRSRR